MMIFIILLIGALIWAYIDIFGLKRRCDNLKDRIRDLEFITSPGGENVAMVQAESETN